MAARARSEHSGCQLVNQPDTGGLVMLSSPHVSEALDAAEAGTGGSRNKPSGIQVCYPRHGSLACPSTGGPLLRAWLAPRVQRAWTSGAGRNLGEDVAAS